MNVDLVILQIRAAATLFAGNVAGAAEFQVGVKNQTWLQLPAAYVVQGDIEGGEVSNQTGYLQIVTEKITVITVLDNTADRRGQTAVATIDQVQKALFAAILNWRPDSTSDNPTNGSLQQNYEARGLRFLDARLGDVDLARLFFEWDFALDVTIGPEDCWQPGSAPLASIAGTFTSGQDAVVLTNTTPT